jgi:hypothetical protein
VKSTGKSGEQGGIWETEVLPDDQVVEAMLVARLSGAR